MKDGFGREINYLRISVTDLCNMRCVYCMPPEGVKQKCHGDIMSIEELAEVARAAAELGVKKLRLTGGEPLVRRGIIPLVEQVASIPGIEDVAMTTNGALLPDMAQDLKNAGLRRVNISLDSLNEDRFRAMTRGGDLKRTLAGIEAAKKAGLEPIKINTVLMGGVNDDEIEHFCAITVDEPIEVRFIELMPIGSAFPFGRDAYLPCSAVPERVKGLERIGEGDVAELYAFPNAKGRVGLISPLSHQFCGRCNRLRLTADGFIKPCLHSSEEINVRGLHGDELIRQLERAIAAKPMQHGALSAEERSGSARDMNMIGG